jgi:hypothetical protein
MANINIPNMHKTFCLYLVIYRICDSSQSRERSLNGGCGFAIPEYPELDKNDYIFDHCTKGADKPREICEEVLLFDGMEQDLR